MTTTAAAPSTTIAAHVGRDGLAYSDRGLASPVGLFAAAADPGTRVRLLGARGNVPLALALHRRGIGVELGYPGTHDWPACIADGPGVVVAACAGGQFDSLAASVGGWRPMTDADAVAYAMAARFDSGGDADDATMALFATHPAYPALSFIPHLDLRRAARLVATILDPRWFVDPETPDRLSRLKCFLGLVGDRPPGSPGRRSRRALATDAWKSTPALPAAVKEPGYFLWRHWAACDGEHRRADLKTSCLFLDYLKATWLDAAKQCPDRLFVPGHFFGRDATAAAWRAHVQAHNRPTGDAPPAAVR